MSEGIVAQTVGVGQIQQVGRGIRVLELDVMVKVAFTVEHRAEIIFLIVVIFSVGLDVPLLVKDPVKALMLSVHGMLDDIFIIRIGEHGLVQNGDIHHLLGDQMPYPEQQDKEYNDNGSHDVVPFQSFDKWSDLALTCFLLLLKSFFLRCGRDKVILLILFFF